MLKPSILVICLLSASSFLEADNKQSKFVSESKRLTPSNVIETGGSQSISTTSKPQRKVVDKILARVNGVNILLSDTTKPRINAQPFTLQEAIDQELYLQEAAKLKMVPSMLEVEKYIAAYRSNPALKNLSDDEFEKYLQEQDGFTMAEFKREYTRYVAVDKVLQTEIQSRIFVTAQEVESYHKEHPQWVDEKYKLRTAIVPFNNSDDEEVVEVKNSDWVDHEEWIEKSNIASSMSSIFDLKKGETSKPIKTPYGYQIVQLIDKQPRRMKTLSESRVSIERMLQEKKMEKFEDDYKKELENKATIVYL